MSDNIPGRGITHSKDLKADLGLFYYRGKSNSNEWKAISQGTVGSATHNRGYMKWNVTQREKGKLKHHIHIYR